MFDSYAYVKPFFPQFNSCSPLEQRQLKSVLGLGSLVFKTVIVQRIIELVINLATMHELCDVTYLVRTAMVDLVYGDIFRLPYAQTTMYFLLCFYGKQKYGIKFLRKMEIRNQVFTENGRTESLHKKYGITSFQFT